MEKQKIGSFLPKEYDWVDEEVIFSSSPLETSNGLNQDFDSDGEQEDLEGKDREDASKDNVSREGEKEKMAKTPALDSFGTDLTQLASLGKLDPMIGREKELERLIQILCRRKKNNPVLIGDPGVGKSAIVEGLAQRIVERKTPRFLFGKRIVSLDTGLLVAGTKYRGQFEERLKSVTQELKKNPNILLFIDEIHTIIGTGGTEGSMDMANMLKPALSRGEIRCIGATTLSEYSKSIEKDGALERRFQKVIVPPTSTEETLDILQNIKSFYEHFHKVNYTDEALKAAVDLTDRYVSDRFFPDKAIDALDEAGARMHIGEKAQNAELQRLEALREDYREKRKAAVLSTNYELAAAWRDKERSITKEIEEAEERLNQEEAYAEVNEGHIARVVALMTGVPVERIAKAETARLKALSPTLKEIVIGQDEAIEKVSKAIQRNRLGLRNEKKPIGSFLFLGSTGVGKTFLAKKLAEQLFGDEDALIRVDMSEFSEKFTVSRLIGAPPGYVGYEEGGQLTEKVRRQPYSVILLDEIEKAHPEVFNMLLTVLDEGALTDSFGRKIDFKNTVIIMTGNVGSRRVSEYGSGLGFRSDRDTVQEADSLARSIIDKELQRTFSPEFLNRLDAVIHFAHLREEDLLRIVSNELDTLQKRFARQHYSFSITEEARKWLARKGFDPKFGVRPLKRLLQTEIEDRFADLILDGEVKSGSLVHFSLEEEHLKASVQVPVILPKEEKQLQ
ncbi:ATP-dependent Clp protease ATP-binding subunit [Porphyromonas gingivicanis]|uniref:ATP-dependent Clp protease ATP-binding subunit n=1 Tax=Porphyromonas gingivicanis TaxID=266762 RepID=UPI00068DAE00|nr:ATP-dependent Clp protease ATP-binding subunit [Porphyromonas gingivicanis]